MNPILILFLGTLRQRGIWTSWKRKGKYGRSAKACCWHQDPSIFALSFMNVTNYCKISVMKKLLRNLAKPKNILFFVALFLVLAMGWHALEFHHEHPQEIFGNDATQVFLHGGDKKYWWMVILAAYLFIASATVLRSKNQLLVQRVALSSVGPLYLRVDLSKLFDPLRIALREGRLQRKICDWVFLLSVVSQKDTGYF